MSNILRLMTGFAQARGIGAAVVILVLTIRGDGEMTTRDFRVGGL
jgi:hypothetical protein